MTDQNTRNVLLRMKILLRMLVGHAHRTTSMGEGQLMGEELLRLCDEMRWIRAGAPVLPDDEASPGRGQWESLYHQAERDKDAYRESLARAEADGLIPPLYHQHRVLGLDRMAGSPEPAPEPMPGTPNLIDAMKSVPNIAETIFPPPPGSPGEDWLKAQIVAAHEAHKDETPWQGHLATWIHEAMKKRRDAFEEGTSAAPIPEDTE